MIDVPKIEDILASFRDWNLDKKSREYLRFHSRRYRFLLRSINEIVASIQGSLRVLDIGPSFESEILRKTLPRAIVDTLGFEDIRFKARLQNKHFQFDLNNAQYKEGWPKIGSYNLVVMAEVIEHLYTSPKLVLECVATCLDRKGYLVIQTPNAVSLNKRLRMLGGKHPYGMIRETRMDPGHFREYTIDELVSIGTASGFVLIDYSVTNYFSYGGIWEVVYTGLCNVLPESFRDGITIRFQKN